MVAVTSSRSSRARAPGPWPHEPCARGRARPGGGARQAPRGREAHEPRCTVRRAQGPPRPSSSPRSPRTRRSRASRSSATLWATMVPGALRGAPARTRRSRRSTWGGRASATSRRRSEDGEPGGADGRAVARAPPRGGGPAEEGALARGVWRRSRWASPPNTTLATVNLSFNEIGTPGRASCKRAQAIEGGAITSLILKSNPCLTCRTDREHAAATRARHRLELGRARARARGRCGGRRQEDCGRVARPRVADAQSRLRRLFAARRARAYAGVEGVHLEGGRRPRGRLPDHPGGRGRALTAGPSATVCKSLRLSCSALRCPELRLGKRVGESEYVARRRLRAALHPARARRLESRPPCPRTTRGARRGPE